jgi:cell division protein FtsZ
MREMGKAMMGTGEASGEKRALAAAEGAISNPLIDDSSMKGAKGLLISITGGKDLTLYEVDEAATRIREEVDKDANIIVGATFDESLEGIIRVSVVATGIDRVVKADARPQREPVARPEPIARGPIPAAIPQPLPGPHAAPARVSSRAFSEIEQAATAAVAAAVLPQGGADDVTIRAMPPKPSLFLDQQPAQPAAPEQPESFIPPQPERVMQRPRMPRIDELPIPAQREIQARRGELQEDHHPEKQRLSLLQRLASVGLGRRPDEEGADEPPMIQPRPTAERAPQRPPARPAESREPVSDYARRGPQGLDQHGRPAPVHNAQPDDQLEIPAFLRRQAN